MEQEKRKMWQYPWRYKESIAFILGIIVVGFVLQITIGNFDFSLLQFPVNIIVGGIIVIILVLSLFFRKSYFLKWISGVPFSVTAIAAILLLGLIMGLTPQSIGHTHTSADSNIFFTLGFDRMTSSWSFVLVYCITLLTLGLVIVRRLTSFRLNDYAFYFNHIGLWILLFSAGLGSSDMRRYVMHVREGETEWRVYSENKDILELPIAIELNDFYMEEYPPNLVVIDRGTGVAQPENKPEYFHIDEKRKVQKIDKWELTMEEYIHEAIRNSDSTYQAVPMPGSSPAIKVNVRNTENNDVKSGWVCSGNISQLYMVLNLDSTYCVAMTQPEPKRFVSDINVYMKDGVSAHTLLEVNKPYKAGSWMLYQYDYDKDAGKMSTYTSIELVYDPWIVPVYIGIGLFALGSICMLWTGNKRKEEQDDME